MAKAAKGKTASKPKGSKHGSGKKEKKQHSADGQAWERGESVQCAPDESVYDEPEEETDPEEEND